MKNSYVVKVPQLKNDILKLLNIISDANLNEIARNGKHVFERKRKLPLKAVISFLTFRHGDVTRNDIADVYREVSGMDDSPSVTAVLNRINDLDPEVWAYIQSRYVNEVYSADTTYKGYVLIAIDATLLTVPADDRTREAFGGFLNTTVKKTSDIMKPQAKLSIAYDPLNKSTLDYEIDRYDVSEIPMMFKMLMRIAPLLKDRKVILLMDRYYPSLKLFKLCELMGWNYIVRAKSNFFKAERAPHQGEDDFWICRSMKPSDLKSIRKVDDEARKLIGEDEDPVNIRVVRHEMSYILYKVNTDKKWYSVEKSAEAVYFTNLPDDITAEEVAMLYSVFRWQVETEFFRLKVHMNIEQFNTHNPKAIINEICGKLFFSNLIGLVFQTAQMNLESREKNRDKPTKYEKKVNFKNLLKLLYKSDFIKAICSGKFSLRRLRQLIIEAVKSTVSVRRNRHFQRWGKHYRNIPNNRHRIDGRLDPPVKSTKAGIISTNH